MALCVPQVFVRLDADLKTVHSEKASQTMQFAKRRSQTPKHKDAAAKSIKTFRSKHKHNTSARLESISDAVKVFADTSEHYMPTGWSNTRLLVDGMQPLNLRNRKTMRAVTALCKKRKLKPPKGFVKKHSYHYGKYENGTMVSFLSLCVMKLNNIPGSIAVSIDIAASTDKNHSMSGAIDSVKKLLRKRRNRCILFTQVALTDDVHAFWSGKLTKTRRASVITALVSTFDERYLIYEDAEDLALFYD
jgi:hypothetical protein